MKLVLLAVFVFFFVVLPMYMLNALLLPELNALRQTYANAGQTADQVETESAAAH